MNTLKIERFNEIIITHPQFKNKSLLYDCISTVLGCTLSQAKEKAATHCNMISFYAALYASEDYTKNYASFFKMCLENKFCNEKGFIQDKEGIIKRLGITTKLITYRDYEDIINPCARLDSDKFYQIKIFGDTSGDHFMTGYIKNDMLYFSDTSYRGIEFEAVKYITKKNFQKITEVC
jgi:hypothetical protein